MQYVFGAFCLDLSRQGLYHGETMVPLEPKVYEVLVYLVGARDRLVTRDELLAQVWGESYVDTSTVARSVGILRRLLGDDRVRQDVIATR